MKFISLFVLAASLSLPAHSKEIKGIAVDLTVTEKGFEPNKINVAPGQPVTLKITRKTDNTCATSIQIPSRKIKRELPLNKTIEVSLGKLDKGEIKFGCGMNMMDSGMIYVQ